MSQRVFWENEYRKRTPAITDSTHPSHAMPLLIDLLRKEGISSGIVLDVGCGRGRNAVFLAQKKFRVTGIDFCEEAIREAREKARQYKVSACTYFINLNIAQKMPFQNDSFDIVLDVLGSGTLNAVERRHLHREVQRILKPGGFFLVYAPNRKWLEQSENAQPFIDGEKGDYFYPSLNLVERAYYVDELGSMFRPLKIILKKEVEFRGSLFGELRFLSYVCGIFRKPRRGILKKTSPGSRIHNDKAGSF